jgi:signal transduction histidine kinase
LAVQGQGQRHGVNRFGDDDDIVDAIAALGHEFLESTGAPRLKYTVIQEGAPRALRPMLRDEVYSIVRTAVRYAADFSHPSVIEVELDFSFGDFRVCVRDNGSGVERRGEGDRQELDSVRRRLRPLKERADEFGGKFKVWSHQQAGTEIEVTFSSQSAYTPRAIDARPWFQHMIGKSWKT